MDREFLEYQDKAEALYRSHNELAYWFKISDEVISFNIIIVSSFITAFLPIFETNGVDTTVLNSVLAFFITIITTVSKSYKPAEKYQKNRVSSRGYLALKAKIKQKLNQNQVDQNTNTLKKLDEIIQKFEKLRKDAPFVHNKLYDKHFKAVKMGHPNEITEQV